MSAFCLLLFKHAEIFMGLEGGTDAGLMLMYQPQGFFLLVKTLSEAEASEEG